MAKVRQYPITPQGGIWISGHINLCDDCAAYCNRTQPSRHNLGDAPCDSKTPRTHPRHDLKGGTS